jgi:hypothetical protein
MRAALAEAAAIALALAALLVAGYGAVQRCQP